MSFVCLTSCGWPDCPVATGVIDVGLGPDEFYDGMCDESPCADGHVFGASDQDNDLSTIDPDDRPYVLFVCQSGNCGSGYDDEYCMHRADLDAQVAEKCPECRLECDFWFSESGMADCTPARCWIACEDYRVE